MSGLLLTIFYGILISNIILRVKFFKEGSIRNIHFLGLYYIKLIAALCLWLLYTYHYKDRTTADIFKYFDDGRVMFSALKTHPIDFFKMLTGYRESHSYLSVYYDRMYSWNNSHESNFYNNSHFIIRLNALFMLLSKGHYGIHVLFMCFISFTGMVFLFKSFYPYLTDKPYLLLFSIFLFPSVLLWSSGVLKEGVVFFGVGITIYFSMKLFQKKGSLICNIIYIITGFILLFETKAYVLLCFMPALIAEYLISRFRIFFKHPFVTYLIVVILYIFIGLNSGKAVPQLNPARMVSDKQVEMSLVARGGIYLNNVKNKNLFVLLSVRDTSSIVPAGKYADSLLRHAGISYLSSSPFTRQELRTHTFVPFRLKNGTPVSQFFTGNTDTVHTVATENDLYRIDVFIEPANSRIEVPLLKPELSDIILHVPQALEIAILRPYPGEIHSAAVFIYFIENNLLFIFLIIALLFIRKEIPFKNIIAFCFTFYILMLTLIGLTTPLYGAIERYKSLTVPFILILLLLITDNNKLVQVGNKLKDII